MYPQELRRKLAEEYRLALQKYVVVGEQEFYARLKHFVLFRMLQVLGAYGFRGYFEKKAHFIESVPPAIANLKELLREGFPEYPYLSVLLLKMTELECFAERKKEDVLTVHVYSFSYKKVFRKTVPEMEGDLYSIAGQSTIRVDTSNTGNRPDWMNL